MSLLKMISSPYSVLCKLRVWCRYTLHFGKSVREFFGSAIKLFTFEIRWAVMSVSVNVESILLVFVQQRYLGSTMKGKIGLSLNFYFSEETFLRASS